VRYHIEKISSEQWQRTHEQTAHQKCFGETLPQGYDRIDFALLVFDVKTSIPVAYVTCQELDADTCYLKYGGVFPEVQGTFNSFPIYKEMINYLSVGYKYLTTFIENKNTVYLKMALSVGFIPCGMKNLKSETYLEFIKER
jgi:hypothetical protein